MADFESRIGINIDAGQALASIKALQEAISAFHTNMAKGSATANIKSLQMQQSLIDSINATGKFSASMKTVASETQAFTTALEKNKMSMGQYFKYAGGASKSFGKFFKTEMETIHKVAIERVKDLQTQYIQMGRTANGAIKSIAVRPLALDMENLATKTALAAQKQQLLNQLLKQGSTNLLNFGKNTQWAGRQLMVGFTIPLGIFAATSAKAYMAMEKQAISFKRVYGDTFTTSTEADKMLQQVKDLSSEFTKYGIAMENTMETAAKAAATGKMGADLLAQVSESTRLSVLGNVDQQKALETTISLTNAFGTAADELRGKINFLNAVENQTVTSIEDLTTAIPKAAPVIKQLGGNVEDLAFFLTAMREGGINASEGANALKSGLASLINPTTKATKMLQGFGINITSIVEKNKGDVKNLVIDFAKALDTLDPLNRARAIEQLFGKFQFSRLSTLFQNVIKDGSQAARVLELTRQSAAELGILAQRELNKISASPMYKFQKAVADFKKELAPVGEEFLKAITPIIQFGTDVLKAFNKLDGGVKQFIINTTGVIAGLGPILLMTFGLIANGVANLIKGFTFVKNIFNKTSSASTVLGETTDYMTQQQLEAAAVAASLDQAHNKLIQSFTVETGAVRQLTQAYEKAISAQVAFTGASTSTGRRGKSAAPKKYATGIVSVPGPKGAGDVVPAMLSPGEAVIPAKIATKYSGFISGMIAGKIPGFSEGTDRIEKIISDFRRRSRSAPDVISNQTKNMDWETFKDEEAAMLEEVEKEIKREAKTESQARDLRNKYIGKDAAHTGRRVKKVSIGNRLVDQKVFASDVITPDARGFNQAFADLIEKRVNQKESGKYKSGSWIGDLLNDKKRVSELAKSVGMQEADLRRELKNFDPMRPGGAQYPTTKNAWKAFEAVAIGSDTTPGRIARAGLRVRNENYGRAGTREAALKAGKLKYDPALDAKAAEQQENRRKNSDRRAKELQAKEAKAKKKNTAAVNKNTDAVKKDTAAVEEQTKTRKKATKTQSKVNATPAITTKEQLGNGITRTVNEKGQEKYYQKGRRGSISATEARNILAGSGAAASPKGRIRGLLTGLPGKLGLAGLATMGAGAVSGNEQVSGLSDKLFQAAMLASFIPQGTMGKIKDKLSPITERLGKTKLGGAIAARYGAGGIAQTALTTFKSEAALSIASKGFMKSMPMMIAGLARVGTKFIPVIGQILLVLDVAFNLLTINARKQEDISKSIVDTLSMTKERLDKVNEFFGTDAKLSGLRSATLGSGAVVGEKQSLAEQFRQSEQFGALYKDQAEKLKGASDKQFAITMQALGIDLMGQGVGEEQVQIIIDAIKKEAGKQDVVINFKDLRIDTETGRKNLAKSLREITKGAIKEYESNRNFLGFNFEATAKLDEYGAQVAGFLSGLSQEFVNGKISVEEFNSSFADIAETARKVDAAHPGDGILFLKETMMATNPELAAGMTAIADYPTYLLAMNAAAKGAALSFELLADAASSIPEIQQGAKDYLDELNAYQDKKNRDIQKQQKLIAGLTTQQKNLQKQEESINDTYDKRIKALERINDLQEQISKQKQSELDLADALSKGDIGAAARIVQQIRADQASLALQQQKNALEDQRDKKTGSLQDKQDALSGQIDNANTELQNIMNRQEPAYKPSANAKLFTAALDQMWSTFGWIWNLTHFWLPEAEKKSSFYQAAGDQIKAVYQMFPGLFPTGKASGGHITGPGSGTSDSIPAMLSNGEYVIRANAVKAIGTDTLDKLNYADRAKFADGGQVGNGSSGYIGPRPTPPFWDEDLRKYVVTRGSGEGFWQIAQRYLPEGRTMDSWWREVIAANTDPRTGKFPRLYGNSKVIIPGYVPPATDEIFKKFMPGRSDEIFKQFMPKKGYRQNLPDKSKKPNPFAGIGGSPFPIGGYNNSRTGGLGLSRMFADGGLVDANNPMSILSAGLNSVMDGIYQNLFGGWANNLRHGSPTMPTGEDYLTMGLNAAPIPGFKGAKAGVMKLLSKFKKPSVLHTPAFKKFTDNAYVNFMRTNPRIAVRMNSDKFIEALNRGDTSYKNRYELKPEMLGEFNANEASQRLKIEENVFGIPKDAPGSARPIYGIASDTGIPWGIRGKEPSDSSFAKYFVRNKTNAMTKSLERYGDISLLLKKKVNKRSTFTIGDSYSAKNFKGENQSIPAKFGTLSRSKILNAKTDNLLPEFQFIEAQIFGGLPFKDIKKILVQDPRMAKIIERELSDAGYKIPVGMPKVNLLGRIIEKLYKNKTYIHEGKDTGLPLFYSSKIGHYADGGEVDKKKKRFGLEAIAAGLTNPIIQGGANGTDVMGGFATTQSYINVASGKGDFWDWLTAITAPLALTGFGGGASKLGLAGKLAGKAKITEKALTRGTLSNKVLKDKISSMYTRTNARVTNTGKTAYDDDMMPYTPESMVPTYKIGNSQQPIAFQGFNQDPNSFYSLSQMGIDVVPSSPKGLLSAALKLRPQDKKLQSMLNNLNEMKIGKAEIDYLDSFRASMSINKRGRLAGAKTVSDGIERTDGLAMVLSALTGNKDAAKIIKFKKQNYLSLLQGASTKRQEGLMAARAGIDNSGGIADPSQVPMIHSTQYDIVRDKNGDILLYPNAHYGANDYARATTHFTAEAPVQSHLYGNWASTNKKIFSPLSSMINDNGLPSNLRSIDSWWTTNPGQPLRLSNASVTIPFTDSKSYMEELVKRGLATSGKMPPIMAVDPNTKEVLHLFKDNYSFVDRLQLSKLTGKKILPGEEAATIDAFAEKTAKGLIGIEPKDTYRLEQWSLNNSQREEELLNLARQKNIDSDIHAYSPEGRLENPSHLNTATFGGESYAQLKAAKEAIRMATLKGHFTTQIKELGRKETGFRHLPGLMNGGLIDIPKFKTGGMFRTKYADGGLALLHDKEFVMNPGAVKEYGVDNLKAMNNGTYNNGSVYNSYGVNISVGGTNANANDIARTVIREIKKLDSQNIRSTRI